MDTKKKLRKMITEISLLTQLQLENFRNQYQYQNKLPTLVNECETQSK